MITKTEIVTKEGNVLLSASGGKPKENHESAAQLEQITVIFINEENKLSNLKLVLDWLKSDFDQQKRPENHFWHNHEIIKEAFIQCNAMVTLNSEGKLTGYLIWSAYGEARIEIDIVEVKEAYRRQGIFKKMQDEITTKFKEVVVLTATVLSQAENAFCNSNWRKMGKKHIKITKPILSPHTALPDGCVIAICSENYYEVAAKPASYQKSMQYFQIKLNDNRTLQKSIITDFHDEGYVGVYLNKKLIAQGKAKHLFTDEAFSTLSGVIAINKVVPIKPELFEAFFADKDAKADKEKSRLLILSSSKTHYVRATRKFIPGTVVSKTMNEGSANGLHKALIKAKVDPLSIRIIHTESLPNSYYIKVQSAEPIDIKKTKTILKDILEFTSEISEESKVAITP